MILLFIETMTIDRTKYNTILQQNRKISHLLFLNFLSSLTDHDGITYAHASDNYHGLSRKS